MLLKKDNNSKLIFIWNKLANKTDVTLIVLKMPIICFKYWCTCLLHGCLPELKPCQSWWLATFHRFTVVRKKKIFICCIRLFLGLPHLTGSLLLWNAFFLDWFRLIRTNPFFVTCNQVLAEATGRQSFDSWAGREPPSHLLSHSRLSGK